MVQKKKLGETALDWITDTTEGEEVLSEQAKSSKNKSAGKSKEKKIGVMKQYVSEGIEKKKEKTPEVIPGISGSSSTITKGKRVMSAKEENKEKSITAERTPVEIGKTYKITEEKEQDISEEEKTVSDKKEDVPDVKKEDITKGKKIIRKKPSVSIPEDSSSIVKKKKETVSQKETISGEEKTPIEKKKTVAVAVKEEEPPSVKRKCMRMSSIGGALKKGGINVSGALVKPFKSDKTKVRKSVSAVINVSKQPVKAISAADRKITQSMKKLVLFGDTGNADKGVLSNIKSADVQITKSAKKLIDSILG